MAAKVDKYNRRGVRTSYVSTLVGISLVLFMIGLVLAAAIGVDNIQKQAKENLSCDLFFQPEMNEADIKQIEQELKSWKYFKFITYVSKERAIEELSGAGENVAEILAILDGENPIPANISFRPKAEYANEDDMQRIKKELLAAYPDELQEVYYDPSSVEDVNLGFKQFVFLFALIAILLIVVAVAMINNTIRLALYSKRFTIKTMQLVGATSTFIRRPFLVQSILQGVVAAIIGTALLMTLIYTINNLLDTVEISMDPLTLVVLFSSILIIGIILSLVSTWFALNKYLRMKLDDLY